MATTKTIQSLQRAAMILDLFTDNVTELSLKEIVDQTELNKSTTFGLVNSLVDIGYLMQNPENQKYCLGIKILSLSNSLRMNNVLIRVAHPYLERLANKYQETIHSAIDGGNASVIYLDKVESDSSILITTKIGVKKDMYCTGVGKCLMAYKSKDELDKILKFPLYKRTDNTFTNRDELYAELDNIRKCGYALDNDEIEVGLSCIAVPIFQAPSKPGFAISVSGATSRIQTKLKETDIINDLKSVASQISNKIYK